MHMPCLLYLLCCKFQTIILKTVEITETQPYYDMYKRQNFEVIQEYVTLEISRNVSKGHRCPAWKT